MRGACRQTDYRYYIKRVRARAGQLSKTNPTKDERLGVLTYDNLLNEKREVVVGCLMLMPNALAGGVWSLVALTVSNIDIRSDLNLAFRKPVERYLRK